MLPNYSGGGRTGADALGAILLPEKKRRMLGEKYVVETGAAVD